MKKAADKGNGIAQSCLGVYYHIGEGVEKDLKQAIFW
jgi:TPR repeat protein